MTARVHHTDDPGRQEALDASARALLDALPSIAFITDAGGATLYANRHYQDYTGLSAASLMGGGWAPLIHPEDREGTAASWAEALRTGLPVEVEYRLRAADGTDRWFKGRAAPQRDHGGGIRYWLGTLTDVDDLKTAQAKAQRSEEQFKALADRVPNFVWFASPDGGVHYLNQRWYDYTGQSPETALPHGWAHVLHPDDAERTAARWAEARVRGDTYEIELRYRRHDGAYRWYVTRAEPLRGAAGEITAWFGTSTNIHDRKLAEEALQELNEELEERVAAALAERKLLADVFETTDAMMAVAGPDLRLRAFNRAYAEEVERLSGRNPRIGDKVSDLYVDVPDLAAAAEANWSRAVAGEVFSITQELGNPTRHRRVYERRFEPLRDREGRLVGAYQFATDVTERLRDQRRAEEAEAARREADALYRAYFQSTSEALFVIRVEADGGFVIEHVNPTHEAQVGFRSEEVAGRRIEEILPPGLAEQVTAAYRRVVESGEIHQYREVFELRGEQQHWDNALVPVLNASGRVSRIFGSSRNVTRQVQAEEVLRQAQKMEAVGQLTGGIAHDFNNLLGAVVGAFDLIRRKPRDPEQVRRLAEAGLETAERGSKLTGQLLTFSRSQQIELKPLFVGKVIEGMRDLLSRSLGPMVQLAFDLREADWPVLSDRTQLEMALLNLAINARDAMPQGGELRIATRPRQIQGDLELTDGRYVELAVSDTGTGMAPEVLARALDPFFTTKGVGKGTGLGLSQVYGIARQAGGTVRLDSRPAVGTTVSVFLPHTEREPGAETAAPDGEGDRTGAGATVLVVDDDQDVRRIIVASLEALGHVAVEAADGPSGLAALETQALNLLLVDFAMPGMNGAEFAKLAREKRPEIPIVFASGYADTAAIEATAGRKARILRKPFRIGELQAVLAEALQGTTPSP